MGTTKITPGHAKITIISSKKYIIISQRPVSTLTLATNLKCSGPLAAVTFFYSEKVSHDTPWH